MDVSPLNVLHSAIRAVPAVKYALGIAGIVSVIAIVQGFKIDFKVAAWGTIIMLILMTVLVIFARVAAIAPAHFLGPALVFTWFALILTMMTAVLMLTSVFLEKPIDLRYWIAKSSENPASVKMDPNMRVPKQPNSTAPSSGNEITNPTSSRVNENHPDSANATPAESKTNRVSTPVKNFIGHWRISEVDRGSHNPHVKGSFDYAYSGDHGTAELQICSREADEKFSICDLSHIDEGANGKRNFNVNIVPKNEDTVISACFTQFGNKTDGVTHYNHILCLDDSVRMQRGLRVRISILGPAL